LASPSAFFSPSAIWFPPGAPVRWFEENRSFAIHCFLCVLALPCMFSFGHGWNFPPNVKFSPSSCLFFFLSVHGPCETFRVFSIFPPRTFFVGAAFQRRVIFHKGWRRPFPSRTGFFLSFFANRALFRQIFFFSGLWRVPCRFVEILFPPFLQGWLLRRP